MMMEWRLLHRMILLGTISLALLGYIYGYFVYIVPVKQEVEQLDKLIEVQETVASNKANEENTIETSTAIQKKLPVHSATENLLIQLSQIEKNTNSLITNFVIEENVSTIIDGLDDANQIPDNIKTDALQLEVTTTNYQQMHAFLTELEGLERIISISQIQFAEGTDANFRFNVSFQTYYNPTLSELIKEAPAVNFTPPADKTNPFQ